MQKRIKHYLHRRFPDFLSSREGIIYFILLIPVLSSSIILLQPCGLYNWHEFHKDLVVFGFCTTFLGTYALVYTIKASVSPHYFNPGTWTIGKQLIFLLTHFFPGVVFSTLVFAHTFIEEFGLSIKSFSLLLLYNIIISVYTALTFGYFVSIKLKKVEEIGEVNEINEIKEIEEINEKEEVVEKEEIKEEEIVKDTELVVSPAIHQVEAPGELPDEITLNGIPFVVNNICYIEGKGNDILIQILRNGILIEISTRYTLKKLESDLKPYSQFLKCQRSFIVNMYHVKDWDIVDGKMVIHPKYCTVDITVRRDKSEEIKEILRKNYIFKAK